MNNQDVWLLKLPEDFIAVSIPYTHKWNAPIWDYNEDKVPQVGLIALFEDGVNTIGESSYFISSYPSDANKTVTQRKGVSGTFDGNRYAKLIDSDSGEDAELLYSGDFGPISLTVRVGAISSGQMVLSGGSGATGLELYVSGVSGNISFFYEGSSTLFWSGDIRNSATEIVFSRADGIISGTVNGVVANDISKSGDVVISELGRRAGGGFAFTGYIHSFAGPDFDLQFSCLDADIELPANNTLYAVQWMNSTGSAYTEHTDGFGFDVNVDGWIDNGDVSPYGTYNVRTTEDVNSIFPAFGVNGSTLTRNTETGYTWDISTDEGFILRVLFSNSTVYMDDVKILKEVFTTNGADGTFSGSFASGSYWESFNGEYYRSATVGDYVEYTHPDDTTYIAHRTLQIANGGYALVSINGDTTAANLLQTALEVVTEGSLPDTVLVVNGGTLNPTDRLLSSYSDTNVWDAIIPVAQGLEPAAHTIRLTVTGYKITAATDCRVYVSGFTADQGTNSPETLTLFECIGFYGSAFELAVSFWPNAGSWTWLGTFHDNETLTGFTIAVDGVDTEMAIGNTVSGDIAITRTSTLIHPTGGDTANTTIVYSAEAGGLRLDQQQEWLLDGRATIYDGMFPVSVELTYGSSTDFLLDYEMSDDSGEYKVQRSVNDAFLWGDTNVIARLSATAPYSYALEDRADGIVNKMYSKNSPDWGTIGISAGQVTSSTHYYQLTVTHKQIPARSQFVALAGEVEGTTQHKGPIAASMEVVSGTTLQDAVVKGALGPLSQVIPEWTGEAEVDLSSFTSTNNTFIGNKLAIYNPAPDAETAIEIQEYVDK